MVHDALEKKFNAVSWITGRAQMQEKRRLILMSRFYCHFLSQTAGFLVGTCFLHAHTFL